MRAVAGMLTLGASMMAGFCTLSSSHAQTIHQVCIGQYESTCKRFPITDFYGCGDTGPNALCFRYCGKPKSPTTCSVTRRTGTQPEPGNQCGYSWVDVRCQ